MRSRPSASSGRRPERSRIGQNGRRTAAASRATPSSAAPARSSTAACTAWAPTGARAPTATWRRTTSSSRPPTPRRGSGSSNGGAVRNPHADDPLFRPIDADDFRTNGEDASDFSNLRQNGLIRIVFPLPPNIRLIDPATNRRPSETFVDVWRAVPTVNDVKLTGPDGVNPWPRGPNHTGGYQLDARVATLQEQALGALINHAQVQNAPPQQLLDDLASFQRVLFTNDRVRALSDAIDAQEHAPARSGSAAERAGAAGQGRVHARVRPLPRRSRAVDDSAAGRPIPRHHDAVPAPGRYRRARALRLRALPAAAGPQRADVRDHAAPNGAKSPPDELRSRPRAVDGIRGRSAPDRRLEQVRRSRASRDPQDRARTSTTTARRRWKRSSITTSSSSSACGSTAPPGVVPPVASTDGVHFDRQPTPEERPALLAYLRKL